MSNRTYNLRIRPGTGVAIPPGQENNGSPPQIGTTGPLREVPPHITGLLAPRAGATVVVRSYSDVMASRTPLPSRERPIEPSRIPELDPNSTLVLNLDQSSLGHRNDRTSGSEIPIDNYNSSMEVGTPDQADSHWTTVQCRHTRSHSSLPDKRTITHEQVKAFDLATERMTHEQKQQIKRRQEKVQPQREDSVSSRGEGPSDPKGKMTDLREWGGLNLSSEDLNMEAHVAALRSFDKKTLDYSKEKKSKHKKRSMSPSRERDQQHKVPKRQSHHSTMRKRASRCSKMPVETQPSVQIAPKSYLGTALENIGRSKGPRYPSESPSSSGSESLSSRDKASSRASSNSSNDDTQSSSSVDDRYQSKRRQDNCHGRNKRRQRSSSGSADNIKLIPPKEYDRSADVRAYHRFVRESEAYLRDGKVRG